MYGLVNGPEEMKVEYIKEWILITNFEEKEKKWTKFGKCAINLLMLSS